METNKNELVQQSLIEDQRRILESLARTILGFTQSNQLGADQLRNIRESRGVFGLLGPRGAGKSTIVEALESEIEEALARQEEAGRKPAPIYFCQPFVDCTALPHDIHFGVSLCQYLAECFDNLESGQTPPTAWEGDTSPSRSQILKEELLPKFLPLDAQYRKLKLDLAVTSSEYQQIAQKELTARQGIRKKVEEVLAKILPLEIAVKGQASRQFGHLLIVLEDADLSVGRLSAELLSIFLNDLGDPRLVFLIVADEEHLEQRIIHENRSRKERGGAQSDRNDVTVRRMLDKLIPVSHRLDVMPWQTKDLWSFRPYGDKEEDKTLEKRLFTLMRRSLEESQGNNPLLLRKQDFARLMPTNPRGLTDLYQHLKALQAEQLESITTEQLLFMLARCRGEHGFARKLKSRSLDWRAARLQWEEKSLEHPRWVRITHEARSNGPIWALEPDELFPETERGRDDALWAEVLLDIGFREDYEQLRALFVNSFEPLREKIAKCNLEFRRKPSSLGQILQEKPLLLSSPWLSYVAETERTIRIEAGWANFILTDPGERFRKLLVALERLPGGIEHTLRPEVLQVAPRSVRSVILLVERLIRLPWAELQERTSFDEKWEKVVPILDLYCADTYQATLNECLLLEAEISGNDPPPDLELEIPPLAVEDLFDQEEAKLKAHVETMKKSLPDPMPEGYRHHPMAIALKHFFAEVVGR